ncbi:MAG: hypothetical protein JWN80_224 [Microbacteriaceae bacterium]|jgi:hypothetical protein|nr:hypothetical protein [Microbacteriaceae bacterium]
MKLPLLALALVIAVPVALVGCSSQTPVVAPVTKSANDLQGTTVKVPLGSMLNINTGSLATSSYSGKVDDPSIAEFVKGGKKDGADFNPGVKPLKVGETTVTLKNAQGGIQNVVFTIDVTK